VLIGAVLYPVKERIVGALDSVDDALRSSGIPFTLSVPLAPVAIVHAFLQFLASRTVSYFGYVLVALIISYWVSFLDDTNAAVVAFAHWAYNWTTVAVSVLVTLRQYDHLGVALTVGYVLLVFAPESRSMLPFLSLPVAVYLLAVVLSSSIAQVLALPAAIITVVAYLPTINPFTCSSCGCSVASREELCGTGQLSHLKVLFIFFS
jgi:hypothetical protein